MKVIGWPVGQDGKGEGGRVGQHCLAPLIMPNLLHLLFLMPSHVHRLAEGVHHVLRLGAGLCLLPTLGCCVHSVVWVVHLLTFDRQHANDLPLAFFCIYEHGPFCISLCQWVIYCYTLPQWAFFWIINFQLKGESYIEVCALIQQVAKSKRSFLFQSWQSFRSASDVFANFDL